MRQLRTRVLKMLLQLGTERIHIGSRRNTSVDLLEEFVKGCLHRRRRLGTGREGPGAAGAVGVAGAGAYDGFGWTGGGKRGAI